ncbi:beta-ketoacyl synthase N-terminal-like domain-containing protein [Dactylosporangium sp. NPDC051484]|uniref:beta-ketoacyl synthase N-terminal-like domain-containing protein n=1 Tax=Dactylosporangium sp. NPDC051484 TaxID=3154942 RepID=UPI00345058C7
MSNQYNDSDIAVIGMACRFPDADSPWALWRNLVAGHESLTYFTDEELLAAGADPALIADVNYVKAGHVRPDVAQFDADLFRVPRDEAEIIDPQQRHFLECAVEALQHAGYDRDPDAASVGRVGVYAGVGLNNYALHNLAERFRTASSVDHYRLMLASDKDFLATRASYKLGLNGPSVSVNTACSTSLVAIHLAALSLLAGDCDLALVGASHLRVPQVSGHLYQEGMIFSPDGHCRAFDAKAQGTIISSGTGVVLLRRLGDALEAGDWVHAVLKGTAINNDGAGKTGYTAPSVAGQAAVIADAQAAAGCPADTISYVEAHGTGTPMGDPIEVAALTEVFGPGTDRSAPCALGTVKTNMGHLDTAAGMAGFIKTVLMLEHRTLVPSLHFETANPEIDFAGGPFAVNTECRDWTADGPLRAGVSSFGIGGTNAHVVLEQAPPRPQAPADRPAELVVLSARSEDGLGRYAGDVARHLRQNDQLDLAAVAQTLALGRREQPLRLAVVANDRRDAAMALALGGDRVRSGSAGAQPPTVVFEPVTAPAGGLSGHVAALREHVPGFAQSLTEALPGRSFGEDEESTRAVAQATAAVLRAWGVRAGETPTQETSTLRVRLLPADGQPIGIAHLLDVVARAWTAGVPIDWTAVHAGRPVRRVPLPAQPFEHRTFWIDPAHTAEPQPERTRLADQLSELDDDAKLDLIGGFVTGEIAHAIGDDEVDPQANLFELGLDSLLLIEIVARLSDEIGFDVPSSSFVEYPTVDEFMRNLAGLLGLSPADADDDPPAATARMSRRARSALAQHTEPH